MSAKGPFDATKLETALRARNMTVLGWETRPVTLLTREGKKVMSAEWVAIVKVTEIGMAVRGVIGHPQDPSQSGGYDPRAVHVRVDGGAGGEELVSAYFHEDYQAPRVFACTCSAPDGPCERCKDPHGHSCPLCQGIWCNACWEEPPHQGVCEEAVPFNRRLDS